MPKGLPPYREYDHTIHIILGILSLNIRPYRYPYAHKIEIEHVVEKY